MTSRIYRKHNHFKAGILFFFFFFFFFRYVEFLSSYPKFSRIYWSPLVFQNVWICIHDRSLLLQLINILITLILSEFSSFIVTEWQFYMRVWPPHIPFSTDLHRQGQGLRIHHPMTASRGHPRLPPAVADRILAPCRPVGSLLVSSIQYK